MRLPRVNDWNGQVLQKGDLRFLYEGQKLLCPLDSYETYWAPCTVVSWRSGAEEQQVRVRWDAWGTETLFFWDSSIKRFDAVLHAVILKEFGTQKFDEAGGLVRSDYEVHGGPAFLNFYEGAAREEILKWIEENFKQEEEDV